MKYLVFFAIGNFVMFMMDMLYEFLLVQFDLNNSEGA